MGVANTAEQLYEGGQKLCTDGVWRRYGRGTMRWGPGLEQKYVGDWLYDEKHGTGERVWGSGEVYNGTWNHDHMDGTGSFRWPDGSKYNGELRAGERSGAGTQTWVEKDGGMLVYEGEWRGDMRDGSGMLTCSDGRHYHGEWVAGRIEGRGILSYCNGWTYEGEFRAGMKHGDGVRTELLGEHHVPFRVRYHYNVLVKRESSGRNNAEAQYEHEATSSFMERRNKGHSGSSTSLLPLESRLIERFQGRDPNNLNDLPLPSSRPDPPPLSPSDNAAIQGSDGRLFVPRHRHTSQAQKAVGMAPEFEQAVYTSNWTLGERE